MIRPASLSLSGSAAAVTGDAAAVCLRPSPDLAQVEVLTVPAQVRTLHGLGALPNLKALVYEGSSDLLGFGELLDWLTGGNCDDQHLLTRIAASLRAGPPFPPGLLLFTAPRMDPPQALPTWRRLQELTDDVIARSAGYGRQDVCLCALCGGLFQQVEYALAMGFAGQSAAYPAGSARLYRSRAVFSGGERVIYGLASLLGLSFRDFYRIQGIYACARYRDKDCYIRFLRQRMPLEDTPALQQALWKLIQLGVLDQNSYADTVELLLSRRLTAAAAFVLDRGQALQGGSADPYADFSL